MQVGPSLQIVVVDDELAVCDALAMTFEVEGWQVISFNSSRDFIQVAKHLTPDCVLLDLYMPAHSGLDVLQAIGGAGYPAPVLMISGRGDIPLAVAAVKAGAHDFVEKPFAREAVIARVRDAVRARTTARSVSRPHFPGAEKLTAREMDVLVEIARGLSNKEAGRILGISPRTVEVHRARVMEKLGARNIADLMRVVMGS